MEKVLLISLKLDLTPSTLGFYGLKHQCQSTFTESFGARGYRLIYMSLGCEKSNLKINYRSLKIKKDRKQWNSSMIDLLTSS